MMLYPTVFEVFSVVLLQAQHEVDQLIIHLVLANVTRAVGYY